MTHDLQNITFSGITGQQQDLLAPSSLRNSCLYNEILIISFLKNIANECLS